MSDWKDTLDTQMRLWRYARTAAGRIDMFSTIDLEALPVGTREVFKGLVVAEAEKLLHADAIYVQPEYVSLVEEASKTFRCEPLAPTDFITPVGFVLLGRPIHLDARGNEVDLVGFSWCPLLSRDDPAPGNGGEASVMLAMFPPETNGPSGVALTLYAAHRGAVLPCHLTPWWYEMTFEGNEVDAVGLPTYAENWWRVVQPCIRLMQQTIAARRTEAPDRAARRRLDRAGFPRLPHERKVVVVTLRRPRHAAEPTGETRDWTHRWIVAGHWRNQWFPSLRRHRQIWIHPHVKGPDDKPLVLTSRRVFDWQR